MKESRTLILAKSIVFSVILISGVALYSIVTIFKANWYFPFLGFGLAIYFAWQEFFIQDEEENNVNNEYLINESSDRKS